MKIHFHYEALDSREQRVARILGRLSWPFTMAGLGGQPGLPPSIRTYCAYFSLPEKDPFSGGYEAVLDPYQIDPMNAAAAQTPASVSQKICTTSQQGDPNAFLLWNTTPGLAEDWDPGCLSLLHSVSYYASWMRRPPYKWDDGTFENRGDVSYGTAPLVVWDPTYLHIAPVIYVLSAAAIDTSLSFFEHHAAGTLRCRKRGG